MKLLLKVTIYCFLLVFTSYCAEGQSHLNHNHGLSVNVDIKIKELKDQILSKEKKSSISFDLKMPDGNIELVKVDNNYSYKKKSKILTLDGSTGQSSSKVRLTITESGTSGIIHYDRGYYIIEQIDPKKEKFRISNINEGEKGRCLVKDDFKKISDALPQKQFKSAVPFPVGDKLRKLEFAVAATGEMTTLLGGQQNALDKIVQIVNATNLIFEHECALTFELAEETEDFTIIFPNAGGDPFTSTGPNAAQTGYNTMNANNILPFANYDLGHVLHAYNGGGASGVAGGIPCNNLIKAFAWTQFGTTTNLPSIISIFSHEVAHQLGAGHTFNATGGNCNQWSASSAVEPGSGSTLMGYGNICNSPVYYGLHAPNRETYFHTKSLEQIFYTLNSASCISIVNTSNTPPTANAGPDITIPKETPFLLHGESSDVNTADIISHSWDQMDVATDLDRGALGNSIAGAGQYTAVNSTAEAPLFRSRISNNSERHFPALQYILDDANDPDDNVGEDLAKVGRTLTFAYTARDNSTLSGGVNSDQVNVIVDGTKGPFLLTSQNSPTTFISGNNYTINWSVNSTNSISPNIKITLSIDGGNTFPYVLDASTTNNGSKIVTIPSYIPSSSQGRIKISSLHNSTHEFLDINNADLTITNSTCDLASSYICPSNSQVSSLGDPSLNFSLVSKYGNKVPTGDFFINFPSTANFVIYTDNTLTICSPQTFTGISETTKFQVSKTGTYNFANSKDGESFGTVTSVFNSSTFDCSSFLGSSGYYTSGNSYGWNQFFSADLIECTDYWAVTYKVTGGASGILNISGPGDIMVEETPPPNSNYTYVAINDVTSQVKAVSASSNFTSLPAGNYKVYGLSYPTGFNPVTLLNQTISQAYNLGYCILLSTNSMQLTVTGPCDPSHFLSGIELGPFSDYETNGIIESDQIIGDSNNPGNPPNTSIIVHYDSQTSILLKQGFETILGTTFEAFIDGCGNLFKEESTTDLK